MAWWRERLEELDNGTAPAEPRLRSVVDELIGRGIAGHELSKLEDAWLPLLEPVPWDESAVDGLTLRGRLLFGIGARLLGGQSADAEAAGVLWSLVDAAQNCRDARSRESLCHAARLAMADLPAKEPANVRPLTVLAAVAAYDLRPSGRLGRVGAAMAHRLRGTMPRQG